MQNKHFKKILQHDIKIGISDNVSKYILAAAFFCFSSLMFYSSAINLNIKASLIDCAIYIYEGMNVYIPSAENAFKIPIIWLLLQIIIAFIILNYPTQDLHKYGIQILTRTKKKFSWWISKCFWNIVSVILFYAVGFVIIFIFSTVLGVISFAPTDQASEAINMVNLRNANNFDVIICVFILPLITSVAVSLLQMAVSFIIKPIYSYICIVSLMLASAYYFSPILIGNFSMLLRNNVVYPNGIISAVAITIDIIIIFISIFMGYCFFKKRDIIGSN